MSHLARDSAWHCGAEAAATATAGKVAVVVVVVAVVSKLLGGELVTTQKIAVTYY